MASDEFKGATHGATVGMSNSSTLILSDCEGTLYKDGDPNDQLLTFLVKAAKAGYEVKFVSNDPSGSRLMLRVLSLSFQQDLDTRMANFIDNTELYPKTAFAREKVFLMFDDDHGSHNIDAEYKLSPNDRQMARMEQYIGATEGNTTKPTQQ